MIKRTDALERWRRVAAGDLAHEQSDPIDLQAWIQEVARQVLAADTEEISGKRVYRLTAAIGLGGKEDAYRELRELIDALSMFPEMTLGREQTQGEQVRGLVDRARADGVLTGIYLDDDKAAQALVRDVLLGRR